MEIYVIALLIGFISLMDRPMLEYTSYRADVGFESSQVNEHISSSYSCSELDLIQEYG